MARVRVKGVALTGVELDRLVASATNEDNFRVRVDGSAEVGGVSLAEKAVMRERTDARVGRASGKGLSSMLSTLQSSREDLTHLAETTEEVPASRI